MIVHKKSSTLDNIVYLWHSRWDLEY